MIYLDYSATTPVNKEVIESFNIVSNNYIGNANSLHKLGKESKNLIDEASESILNLLKLEDYEVIYTSGSTEANNLAIKGVALKYANRGKHIIISPLEHSSVIGPISYLQKLGYEVDIVKILEDGTIDLNNLQELIKDETILVSIVSVSSEIGIKQPIEKIANIINNYPKCYFHVDLTQSIGKVDIDLKNVDLISFSAHKIYGLKGIGALVKRKNIVIEPLLHGGKSTTVYRSGTPATSLIVSLARALRLVLINNSKHYDQLLTLNKTITEQLKTYPNFYINSTNKSIPHIINFSVTNIKPETLLRALEEKEIYISTKSACSKNNDISKEVYSLTNDNLRSSTSLRISLSYMTSKEEVDKFLMELEEIIKRW